MKNFFKNHWIVVLMDSVCVLLAAFAVLSVFLPDNVTSHPEYHRWIYKVTANGNSFRWSDFLKSFDVLSFDWVRPRFIDYFFIILNVKLRLFLYTFFIPFKNLSLHFIITLFLAPVLFYKFAKNILQSKSLAFYATVLYITSVGFLSNLVTLFQPAKALAHVAVLGLFFLLSELVRKNSAFSFRKDNYKLIFSVLALNFIGTSVDETYLVMAVAAVLVFYSLFFPPEYTADEFKKSALKVLLYFLPFLIFLIFLSTFASQISSYASGTKIDFIEWISAKNQEMGNAPVLPLFLKMSSSLLASAFSPIFLLGERLPIMLKPVWSWESVRLYGAFVALVFVALVSRFLLVFSPEKIKINLPAITKSSFFKKRIISFSSAILIFLILQTFLMRMHPVVSGAYYYSSLFSILTAVLIVLLFGRGRRQWEKDLGGVIIIIFMATQLANFYDLNSRWKLFHLQWIHLESVSAFPKLLRSDSLMVNRDWIDNKQGLPHQNNEHKDGLERNYAKEKDIWHGWKKGVEYDLKNMSDFTEQDALFLHEMDVLMNNKRH